MNNNVDKSIYTLRYNNFVNLGVKPEIKDSQFSIANYGHRFNCILIPITNSLYKENIRTKYISFINNPRNTSLYNNSNEFSISFPTLEEITTQHLDEKDENLKITKKIGLLSSWIDLGTTDPLINKISLKVITNELRIGVEMHGIDTFIISPPKDCSDLSSYAEIIIKILDYIKSYQPRLRLCISLPITTNDELVNDRLSTWELWIRIKCLCKNNSNLYVSLALVKKYLSLKDLDFLTKWLNEHVDSILISSSVFQENKFAQPVLNKINQLIIEKFQEKSYKYHYHLSVLLHGLEKYPKFAENIYIDYMDYILAKNYDKMSMLGSQTQENLSNTDVYNNLMATLEAQFVSYYNANHKAISTLLIMMPEKQNNSYRLIDLVVKTLLNQGNSDLIQIFVLPEKENGSTTVKINELSLFIKQKDYKVNLSIVNDLQTLHKPINMVLTDNISNIELPIIYHSLKSKFKYLFDDCTCIPEQIIFSCKPICTKENNQKQREFSVGYDNYISLSNEKEVSGCSPITYKINKKHILNGLLLSASCKFSYGPEEQIVKIRKFYLPLKPMFLNKDMELEISLRILQKESAESSTDFDKRKLAINYTASLFIYLVNEQLTGNVMTIGQLSIDEKDALDEKFPKAYNNADVEIHERCLILFDELYIEYL
ncbi:uncharacterized protein HGUI_01511 [Hanseniaspora guilliermondii]|uniref:PRMT5 TIM barrel domain-containing protein n=1 Tax=Hanseniaspora guilliermondii TaxID=56406 RepID=A0A1L0CWX6_9ASCO|nr:uncharacterized protein HGUI_01511 [Hanseniaspora guilliermondii]